MCVCGTNVDASQAICQVSGCQFQVVRRLRNRFLNKCLQLRQSFVDCFHCWGHWGNTWGTRKQGLQGDSNKCAWHSSWALLWITLPNLFDRICSWPHTLVCVKYAWRTIPELRATQRKTSRDKTFVVPSHILKTCERKRHINMRWYNKILMLLLVLTSPVHHEVDLAIQYPQCSPGHQSFPNPPTPQPPPETNETSQ